MFCCKSACSSGSKLNLRRYPRSDLLHRRYPGACESSLGSVQIVNMIKKDKKISTDKMAMVLGISSKTVKRHIKELKIIHYVGRGSNGHWEIADNID